MNRYQAEALWRRFLTLCGEEAALIVGAPTLEPGGFLDEWAGAMKNGKIQPPPAAQMSFGPEAEEEPESKPVPWSKVVPDINRPIRWEAWTNEQRRYYLALQVPRDIYDAKIWNDEVCEVGDAASYLGCNQDLLYRLIAGKLRDLVPMEDVTKSFIRHGFHVRVVKAQFPTLKEIVRKHRETFKR